jgi:hypothetical protein
MGGLVADGKEGLPRRRARDGIHEPVASLLHLLDGRVVVLQIAIRQAAAGAAGRILRRWLVKRTKKARLRFD